MRNGTAGGNAAVAAAPAPAAAEAAEINDGRLRVTTTTRGLSLLLLCVCVSRCLSVRMADPWATKSKLDSLLAQKQMQAIHSDQYI